MSVAALSRNVEILAPVQGPFSDILTAEAIDFVAAVHRQFGQGRKALLAARGARQKEI